MKRPISPTLHGIIDYAAVPLLVAAGPMLGFDGLPAKITSTLAGIVLVYSASTAYPPGIVRLISLKAHRALDIALGAGLIVAPWLFGFQHVGQACSFFVGFGALILVVVMLTDFSAESKRQEPGTGT